ncbi:unnamed protein product [Prorocentrum cordatum]|uniref:Uncharacterized protein n=1 Tax=Prorocentrum cordatum TaxID=2364126 RepID=A0ABN9TIJ5_9DINO|nr:unnamed protein product [Polarella glacialis]
MATHEAAGETAAQGKATMDRALADDDGDGFSEVCRGTSGLMPKSKGPMAKFCVHVATCKDTSFVVTACGCQSSAENPIRVGKLSEWKSIPWLYGDEKSPEGKSCTLCYNTFTQGGFLEEFGSIQKMLDKAPNDVSIMLQFKAARLELIKRINNGEVELRLRGAKKEDRKKNLLAARQRSIEMHQSAGTVNRSKFRVMTVQRYKDTHNDRTPEDDGLDTCMQYHKGKLEEVVLLATMAEGEWEMDIEDRMETIKKEVIDDGKNVIRDGQIESKFEAKARRTQAALDVKASTEQLLTAEALEEAAAAREEEHKHDDDEESRDSALDTEDSDDFLAGVLNKNRKTAKATKDAPSSAAKTASGRTKEESQVQDVVVDVDAYLDRNGLRDILGQFEESMNQISEDAVLNAYVLKEKDISDACKKAASSINDSQKSMTKLFWKIEKRSGKPEEATKILTTHRETISDTVKYFQTSSGGKKLVDTLDVEKVAQLTRVFEDGRAPPPACQIAFYVSRGLHLAVKQNLSELKTWIQTGLDKVENFPEEDKWSLIMMLIERLIAFMLDGVSGKSESKDRAALEYTKDFIKSLLEIPAGDLFGPGFENHASDLTDIQGMFDFAERPDMAKEQEQGLVRLHTCTTSKEYVGFFRAVGSHGNFERISKCINDSVAEAAGGTSFRAKMTAAMCLIEKQRSYSRPEDALTQKDAEKLSSCISDLVEEMADSRDERQAAQLDRVFKLTAEHGQDAVKGRLARVEKYAQEVSSKDSCDELRGGAMETACSFISGFKRSVESGKVHVLHKECKALTWKVVESTLELSKNAIEVRQAIKELGLVATLMEKMHAAITYRFADGKTEQDVDIQALAARLKDCRDAVMKLADGNRTSAEKAVGVIMATCGIEKIAKEKSDSLGANLTESIVVLLKHVRASKGLDALASSAADACSSVMKTTHLMWQLSACIDGDQVAVRNRISTATSLAQCASKHDVFSLIAALPAAGVPTKKAMLDLSDKGAREFKENLERLLGRDSSPGLASLADEASELNGDLVKEGVGVLGDALDKLNDKIDAYAKFNSENALRVAKELEDKYLTNKEDDLHGEFLKSFDKNALKALTPEHARVCGQTDNTVQLLTDLGLKLLPVDLQKSQDIIARLSAMSIKWALFSLLQKEDDAPGTQIDKIKKLVDDNFTEEFKKYFDDAVFQGAVELANTADKTGSDKKSTEAKLDSTSKIGTDEGESKADGKPPSKKRKKKGVGA